MPTYEYACTACERRFEVVQRFSDAPLETCEVCGGTVKRVFHPVGIVLKGSGFYATDNRGGKKTAPPPASKETKSSTSDSTSSSSTTSSGSDSSPSSGSTSGSSASAAS